MKDKQRNELFIHLIRQKIKEEKKVVGVVSEILNIQKEAAYRRLRSEVAFTFSEIIDICCALSISLDHILGIEKLCLPYQLYGVNWEGSKRERTVKVRRYLDIVANIAKSQESEYAEVTDSMPIVFILNSDYLLKWYLYIWDYHRYYNAEYSLKKFHEYDFEQKMTEYSKITATNLKKFNNTFLIINTKFLEDMSDDIKNNMHLKHIRREDVENIKKELILFLNYLEKIVISGCYPETGKKISVYISDYRIRSGFAYIKSTYLNASILKLFSFNGALSLTQESFGETVKWYKSYERLSNLISVSCEFERTTFFEKQRQIVDAL